MPLHVGSFMPIWAIYKLGHRRRHSWPHYKPLPRTVVVYPAHFPWFFFLMSVHVREEYHAREHVETFSGNILDIRHLLFISWITVTSSYVLPGTIALSLDT